MKICQENLSEKLSTALKRSGENETKSYTYETTSDNRAFTYVYTTEVTVKNILNLHENYDRYQFDITQA